MFKRSIKVGVIANGTNINWFTTLLMCGATYLLYSFYNMITAETFQNLNVLILFSDARLHHTVNAISQSNFIIYGGRTSPAKPCTSTILLSIENHNGTLLYKTSSVAGEGSVPTPRWRHSAVLDSIHERLLVYGGRTTGGRVLEDMWWMDINGGSWSKVSTIYL